MRIGVLGGTFDPPHLGHLALAKAALDHLRLDEVMFLPVHRNPLKTGRQTSGKDRLEMVKAAIMGEPHFSVSDIEIVRGGKSYAVDTLSELNFVQPAEYWFLVGSDALADFTGWKQPEKLVRLCRLGVALRGGQDKSQMMAKLPDYARRAIDWVDMSPQDISATELRLRMEAKRPARQWLPKGVLEYIDKHHLYGS